MKKFLVTFLILIVNSNVLPAAGRVVLSPENPMTAVHYEVKREMAVKKKRKKKKTYKKPKKKKFLGIFKRKSACDCPKH